MEEPSIAMAIAPDSVCSEGVLEVEEEDMPGCAPKPEPLAPLLLPAWPPGAASMVAMCCKEPTGKLELVPDCESVPNLRDRLGGV